MLRMQSPTGKGITLQPHLVRNKVRYWNATSGANNVPGIDGILPPTALGTATARTLAATNRFTRMARMGYVSVATAPGFAGHYNNATNMNLVTIGNGAGEGGFHLVSRFGCSDPATVAGARQFAGLSNPTAAPTNVEPSTLINTIGVGHGAADTNLKLYYGGSAAQAPIDLGANFPANTLSVDMYELALFASPNNQDVGYRVENLRTGSVAEGVIPNTTPGTTLPLNTAFMGWRIWRCNNATALACAVDVVAFSVETDY